MLFLKLRICEPFNNLVSDAIPMDTFLNLVLITSVCTSGLVNKFHNRNVIMITEYMSEMVLNINILHYIVGSYILWCGVI